MVKHLYTPKSILTKRVVKLCLIQLLVVYDANNHIVRNQDIDFVIDVNQSEFSVSINKEMLLDMFNHLVGTLDKITIYLNIEHEIPNVLLQIMRVAILYTWHMNVKKSILIKEFLIIAESFMLHKYCPMIHKLIDKA